MRLTAEQKREIERVMLEVSDKLFEIKEKTGISLSIAAYGNNPEYPCIFLHTKNEIATVDERSEINGYFKSEKWRNRTRKTVKEE